MKARTFAETVATTLGRRVEPHGLHVLSCVVAHGSTATLTIRLVRTEGADRAAGPLAVTRLYAATDATDNGAVLGEVRRLLAALFEQAERTLGVTSKGFAAVVEALDAHTDKEPPTR